VLPIKRQSSQVPERVIIVTLSYGMGLGLHQLRVLLSGTQLETPIAHFPGSPRSQSMDTVHHEAGVDLNLDRVGTKL
jgi:hypothetical protein